MHGLAVERLEKDTSDLGYEEATGCLQNQNIERSLSGGETREMEGRRVHCSVLRSSHQNSKFDRWSVTHDTAPQVGRLSIRSIRSHTDRWGKIEANASYSRWGEKKAENPTKTRSVAHFTEGNQKIDRWSAIQLSW